MPPMAFLEQLLVYPTMDSVGAPSEIKPIEMPAGHFRIEKVRATTQAPSNSNRKAINSKAL